MLPAGGQPDNRPADSAAAEGIVVEDIAAGDKRPEAAGIPAYNRHRDDWAWSVRRPRTEQTTGKSTNGRAATAAG